HSSLSPQHFGVSLPAPNHLLITKETAMISGRKILCAFGLCLLLLCMARVGAAQATCNPTWVSTTAYTVGMKVSLNGINYTANFWTQGQNPSTNNGGPGSGQPWTIIGNCSACTTVPSVPTGLQASGTTSNSTNLSWNASTVAVNCVLTGYTVFRNGVAVGTTSSPNMTVTGLSPVTTYSF